MNKKSNATLIILGAILIMILITFYFGFAIRSASQYEQNESLDAITGHIIDQSMDGTLLKNITVENDNKLPDN